jgi:glycosyltransferase involved in cell wall biosynthesis
MPAKLAVSDSSATSSVTVSRAASMSGAIVVASKGRPKDLATLVQLLEQQSLKPSIVLLVGTCPEDMPDDDQYVAPSLTVVKQLSPRAGLTAQRNVGLRYLRKRWGSAPADEFVAFFDDDFRPSPGWLASAAEAFRINTALVGLTGRVLADGINTDPISEADADGFIRHERPALPHWSAVKSLRNVQSLYGCNMAVRGVVAERVDFDENLPLYGWQEDCDYSGKARRFGVTAIVPQCEGVHLGVKSSRVSGLKMGYSQIANPIYIANQGNMPWSRAVRFLCRAIASNVVRAGRRSGFTDYKGRLRGNVVAIGDLVRRRCTPQRITELA